MTTHPFLKLYLLILCAAIYSCTPKKNIKGDKKIIVQEINGKYSILKNGKIFTIKGASGYINLDELKRCGGNTIRIWDTTNVDKILKDANKNGISVIVGISIPESQYLSYYNNTSKVSTDFKKIKKLINRLKSNPAILMWCVGNELVFPNKPSYYNFYKEFNNIVDMIHEDDPDHPVTTTMVNFQKNDLVNLKIRTNIDVISFNIFSRITELKDDLKNFSWFWDGAYLITEWGIDGPWQGAPGTA
ncbi:glycoside hydrolase family 2 TIM barrel-domain containing protein [Pedobacter lithocola]|uniref:Glycoside hydrolase family 2 TIM barrel-domain containing protein n=1 Tax=Pedobacter lithocola TaxID=1908239 RepID=A0ABV8PF02_9SPHI